MIRILVIAVIAFVLYKLLSNEARKRAERKERSKETDTTRRAEAGQMVKDPVCGAYVDVATSVRVRDGETVYLFCGYECRDAFLQKIKEGGGKIPENCDRTR